VSHDPAADLYFGSVTAAEATPTHRLDSDEGRALLNGSTLLGFVEGNSVGYISARNAQDPPTRFNKWKRQDFNQPTDSVRDGGKVWEHWCTVRDIRSPHAIAASVLSAYVSVAAVLGDRFVPTVARGRRSYGHPKQLCAMVLAGLTSERSATWDVQPDRIPGDLELKLLEATPRDEAAAAAALAWDRAPHYYMFERRIQSWSPTARVREDLRRFQGV
jgi:hypothetical protein